MVWQINCVPLSTVAEKDQMYLVGEALLRTEQCKSKTQTQVEQGANRGTCKWKKHEK